MAMPTKSKEKLNKFKRIHWPCWEGGLWLDKQPSLPAAWKTCPRADWLVWALEELSRTGEVTKLNVFNHLMAIAIEMVEEEIEKIAQKASKKKKVHRDLRRGLDAAKLYLHSKRNQADREALYQELDKLSAAEFSDAWGRSDDVVISVVIAALDQKEVNYIFYQVNFLVGESNEEGTGLPQTLQEFLFHEKWCKRIREEFKDPSRNFR